MSKLKPGDLVVVYSRDGFPVTKPSMLVKIALHEDYKRTAYHTLTNGKIEVWEAAFWKVCKHENRRSSKNST